VTAAATRHRAALFGALAGATTLALLLVPQQPAAAGGADTPPERADLPHANEAIGGVAVDGEDVAIVEHSAYWTDVLSAVASLDGTNLGNQLPLLFVIRGSLRNTAATPLHHVLLAFEVLDRDGHVVAVENGYNRRAETLRPIDSPFPMADDTRSIEALPSGATDGFRMILVGPDTPPFATYRVRVLAAPKLRKGE